MTYTNWGSVRPSPEDLDERVQLFIVGRFGENVARSARTHKVQIAA